MFDFVLNNIGDNNNMRVYLIHYVNIYILKCYRNCDCNHDCNRGCNHDCNHDYISNCDCNNYYNDYINIHTCNHPSL